MSYTESKDYNEFNMNKLLSIRPKLKLNRSIYNNNNKIPTNSYTYKDDNSSEIDLLSEMTIESQSKKSSDDVSINNEFTMNTSIYKNQELKCISVISNFSIMKRKHQNNYQASQDNNESNYNFFSTEMDISDEEINSFNSELNDNNRNNNMFLPCREEEQKEIYNYIKNGLKTYGSYNSLYICGMTGTGKTESVTKVIEIIEGENKENNGTTFRSLFLNCVDFDTNMKLIKCIYNFIFSKKAPTIKASKYLNILDNFFSERNNYNGSIYLNDPTNSHIILIIDEIDYLINKCQILLYHIFNWSTYKNSKLIIISISNLINIKDLFLDKILSRFGQNKLMLKPYTKEQIREILNYKGINLKLFDEDALKLTAMKVAAINGDLRRVILILKHAIEIYNNDIYNNLVNNKNYLINKFYIIKSCSDLFDNKIISAIKNLGVYEKTVIASILFNINKEGNNLIKIEKIYDIVNLLLEKYNEYNYDNDKIELDITWDDFKRIIYNLNRIKIIQFNENNNCNFKDNFIFIKVYVDEFSIACESDKDFEPIKSFLFNSVN